MSKFRSDSWPRPLQEPERKALILASQISWGLTVGLLAIVSVVIATTPLTVKIETLPLNVVLACIFFGVGYVYTYRRFDPVISTAGDCLGLLCAFGLVSAVYSYVATYLGAGFPLWDARFAAADAVLHFDWMAYLDWLKTRPTLFWLFGHAYASILNQAVLAALVLSVTGQYRRIRTFMLAVQLSLLLAGAIACLMPALGAYIFYDLGSTIQSLVTSDRHIPHVLNLRVGDPVIPLDDLDGIITFPSFHTTLGILFAWAFWRTPFLRWIALVSNGALIAATPLHGGHYFVDVLAGALIGIVAIAVASALWRFIFELANRRISIADRWADTQRIPSPAGSARDVSPGNP